MQENFNKIRSNHLIIFLIITLLFFIIYGWGNFRCGLGIGGSDQPFCYLPMAASLLDNDPSTTFTCKYGFGRGIIHPLVYAFTWKATYGLFNDFDYQTFEKNQMPKIGGLLGAFYVIFALFILLALSLRMKHSIAFLIAMGFYLQIDPFFESLNNGHIDCLYLFTIAIGMYFLSRVISVGKTKYFCMLGVVCFVLPTIRANGLFFMLWTFAALGVMLMTRLTDKEKLITLLKQSVIVLGVFAICNILYEVFIYSVGWQPDVNIYKHHPLIIMFLPSVDLNLYGMGGEGRILTNISNTASLTTLMALLKEYLSNLINNIHYMFLKTHGGFLNQYWHCPKTILHLLHRNYIKFPVVEFTIITANIIFVIYQIQKKDKVILLLYLGAFCYFVTQSFMLFQDARYYIFIYFVIFYPFFWLLDELAGRIKYRWLGT